MPFRAGTPFLPNQRSNKSLWKNSCISALSGWCFISTKNLVIATFLNQELSINALSGLCFISTLDIFHPRLLGLMLYQCPLELVLHFYLKEEWIAWERWKRVSMPSRAGASFLRNIKMSRETWKYVSMPSRADAPFLPINNCIERRKNEKYQCPLGLGLHFYYRDAQV